MAAMIFQVTIEITTTYFKTNPSVFAMFIDTVIVPWLQLFSGIFHGTKEYL